MSALPNPDPKRVDQKDSAPPTLQEVPKEASGTSRGKRKMTGARGYLIILAVTVVLAVVVIIFIIHSKNSTHTAAAPAAGTQKIAAQVSPAPVKTRPSSTPDALANCSDCWQLGPGVPSRIPMNAKDTDLDAIFGTANLERTHKSEEVEGSVQVMDDTVIFPNDPTKTARIHWESDSKRTAIASISVNSVQSVWTAFGGLRIGMPVADVEKINGRPFTILGFGSEMEGIDMGGMVDDWNGGDLQTKAHRVVGVDFKEQVPQTHQNGEHKILSNSTEFTASKPIVASFSVTGPESAKAFYGYNPYATTPSKVEAASYLFPPAFTALRLYGPEDNISMRSYQYEHSAKGNFISSIYVDAKLLAPLSPPQSLPVDIFSVDKDGIWLTPNPNSIQFARRKIADLSLAVGDVIHSDEDLTVASLGESFTFKEKILQNCMKAKGAHIERIYCGGLVLETKDGVIQSQLLDIQVQPFMLPEQRTINFGPVKSLSYLFPSKDYFEKIESGQQKPLKKVSFRREQNSLGLQLSEREDYYEPKGFAALTFYLDRPDKGGIFKMQVQASNGNVNNDVSLMAPEEISLGSIIKPAGGSSYVVVGLDDSILADVGKVDHCVAAVSYWTKPQSMEQLPEEWWCRGYGHAKGNQGYGFYSVSAPRLKGAAPTKSSKPKMKRDKHKKSVH